MLASSLHLIDAPTQIASLYIVASTDAGGRMHNDGKLPYLEGFAYPPNCTLNHKKIAPPKKQCRCPRSQRDQAEKGRVVASLWYAASTDAGRRSFDVGERSNEWPLLWAFGVTPFVTIRPHAKNGAGAPPVGQIGPPRDTGRIPGVWRGCQCLGVGVRRRHGVERRAIMVGGWFEKKLTCL